MGQSKGDKVCLVSSACAASRAVAALANWLRQLHTCSVSTSCTPRRLREQIEKHRYRLFQNLLDFRKKCANEMGLVREFRSALGLGGMDTVEVLREGRRPPTSGREIHMRRPTLKSLCAIIEDAMTQNMSCAARRGWWSVLDCNTCMRVRPKFQSSHATVYNHKSVRNTRVASRNINGSFKEKVWAPLLNSPHSDRVEPLYWTPLREPLAQRT